MRKVVSKAAIFLLSIMVLLSSIPLESMIVVQGASEPGISVSTDLLEYQSISVYPGDDQSEIVALDGMMPAESDLVVSRTGDAVSEETLCSYDISILNNGREFQPDSDNPITVSITNAAIGEANSADKPICLWHIGGDGSVTKIEEFTISGDTISFSASGFSVYIVSSEGEPPLRTYEFYAPDETGTYVKYYYSTSNGDMIWRQTVQSGDKLSIPQLPSLAESSTSTFMGWYVYKNGSLSFEPLDFENLPPITETETVQLRAVFANCAYIIFHEQYNGANNSWPIAATRRGEISGNSTQIQIDDITVTYDDSSGDEQEQQNKSPQMIFRGWSKQKVTIPGSTTDDNGDPIVLESSPMTISGNTDLYPVFSNIRWLTFVSGRTGTGATYVSPKYYYVDEGATDLPGKETVKRTGYVFDGWFTAEEGGTRITDEDGNIVAPVGPIAGTDLAVAQESGHKKLIVNEDTTIYGQWRESDASYTVVIKRQQVTDDVDAAEKSYDYAESFRCDSITGTVITEPDYEFRNKSGSDGYEGFHYSHCDTNVEVNGDGTTVINVYYDRNVHTFSFKVSNREIHSFSALYGSDISQRWSFRGSNNVQYPQTTPLTSWQPSGSSTYTLRIIKMMTMPDEDITFTHTTSSNSTRYYHYYVEALSNASNTRSFNGKQYSLYTDLTHNYGVVGYNDDFWELDGFTRQAIATENGTNVTNTIYNAGNRGASWQSGWNSNLYFYYTRNKYKFDFVDTDETILDTKMIPFGDNVESYLPDNPEAGDKHKGYRFKGWFYDKEGQIPVDFEDMTMPSNNLKVYAGWEAEWYLIEIDPNGGVLGEGQSTWFWKIYQSDEVREYTTVTRNYIEDPRGSYFYHVLDRAAYGLGDEWESREDDISDRTTYYSSDLDNAVNYTRYKYMPGAYRYAGWYEVDPVTGEETLYKFGTLVTGNLKLRLHWKQVGTYYIYYDPHEGTLDDQDSNEETFKTLDDSDYADHSSVVITRTAIPPEGYNFIGWTIRKDPSGRVYYPGQAFEFNSAFTEETLDETGNKKYTIFLDPVYRKIETATLIYDANGGTVDENTVDYGDSLLALESGDMHPKMSCNESQAIISSLYDNSPIRLSSGAGFSNRDYVFLGWNTEPDGSGTQFDPQSIVGDPYVDTEEPITLYAMWRIKVYFDKNKDAASWGDGWNEPEYHYDSVKGQYYTEMLLNAALEAPEGVPYISDPDQLEQGEANTFRYWSLGRYTDNESNAPPYVFGEPVTGEMTLYGFWTGELEVPVHAVDASERELVIRDSEWLRAGKEVISIGNEEVPFRNKTDADVYADAHEGNDRNYSYQFACVCNKNAAPENISEDKKIDYLYYNVSEMSVWVHYSSGEDKPLKEEEEVYLIYYKDPSTVPIGYKDMAPSGGLTNTENVNSQAPVEADIYQTTYHMKDFVTRPLGWAGRNNSNYYYSFAIGDPNAADASELHFITQAVNSDSNRPDLRVKNTWRGYKYSLDGGETWNDAGYDIQLYVVYYPSQPTILTLNEKTIGLPEDMNREFTYTVTITEKTITETVRQYYTNSNYNTYGDSTVISTNEGSERTVLESDEYCRLSDGMAESITLFHSENRVRGTQQREGSFFSGYKYYTDDTITTTYQTITIVQEIDSRFTTNVEENFGSHSRLTYTFTTDATSKDVQVTYTNRREPYRKELHTAIAQAGVFVEADSIRTEDDSVYAKDMALGET